MKVLRFFDGLAVLKNRKKNGKLMLIMNRLKKYQVEIMVNKNGPPVEHPLCDAIEYILHLPSWCRRLSQKSLFLTEEWIRYVQIMENGNDPSSCFPNEFIEKCEKFCYESLRELQSIKKNVNRKIYEFKEISTVDYSFQSSFKLLSDVYDQFLYPMLDTLEKNINVFLANINSA